MTGTARWSAVGEAVAGVLTQFKSELVTMLHGWGIGPDGVDLSRARGDASIEAELIVGARKWNLSVEDPASIWVRAVSNWTIEWISLDAAVAAGSTPISIAIVKNTSAGTIGGTASAIQIPPGDDQAFYKGTAVLDSVTVVRGDRFRIVVTGVGVSPTGSGLSVGLWGDPDVNLRRPNA